MRDADINKSILDAYKSMYSEDQPATNTEVEVELKQEDVQVEVEEDIQEKVEEKLDPVGKEDGDIDNDGDIDDSDKYLSKRRKAISKATKKESLSALIKKKHEKTKKDQESAKKNIALKNRLKKAGITVKENEELEESDLEEARRMSKGEKPFVAKAGDFNFAVNISGVENDYPNQGFSGEVENRKAVVAFTNDPKTKKTSIGAKGKSTLAAVKAWVKQNPNTEFYAKWRPDSSTYKDDSVDVYYRPNSMKESVELEEANSASAKALSDIKKALFDMNSLFAKIPRSDKEAYKFGREIETDIDKIRRKIFNYTKYMKESVELDEARADYKSNRSGQYNTKVTVCYISPITRMRACDDIWFKSKMDALGFKDNVKGYPKGAEVEAIKVMKESVELEEASAIFKKFSSEIKAAGKGDCPKIVKDIEKALQAKKITASEFDELTADAGRKMDKLKEARVNQGADLYFDTYTSAVQKAKADAEKAGYKVDEDDWDTQITTGQGKPSRGKTVRHNIKLTKNGKPTRKGLAIQVFNRDTDSKTYELNSYVS
jgi:hypothetical protein